MGRGVLAWEGEDLARERDVLVREFDAPARGRLPLDRLDEVRGDDERVEAARLEDRRERDLEPAVRDFAAFVSLFSARILLTVRAATSAARPL